MKEYKSKSFTYPEGLVKIIAGLKSKDIVALIIVASNLQKASSFNKLYAWLLFHDIDITKPLDEHKVNRLSSLIDSMFQQFPFSGAEPGNNIVPDLVKPNDRPPSIESQTEKSKALPPQSPAEESAKGEDKLMMEMFKRNIRGEP